MGETATVSHSVVVVPVVATAGKQEPGCQCPATAADRPLLDARREYSSLEASLTNNDDYGKGEMCTFQVQSQPPQNPGAVAGANCRSDEHRERRCRFSLRVLVIANILLMILVVSVICVVPLETTSRKALNLGLQSTIKSSSEMASKSTANNFILLQEVISTIALSLQFNQTVQLHPWRDTSMPTVMQQLCGFVANSVVSGHLLYLHLSSPYSGYGAYCSRQYDGETLIGKYVRRGESDYRYEVDRETLKYAEPKQPFLEVSKMTERQNTVDFAAPDNPFLNIAIPWVELGQQRRWWVFARSGKTMVTYTYPFRDYLGKLAVITGALQLGKLQSVYPEVLLSEVGSSMVVELQSGLVLSTNPNEGKPTVWDNWNCTVTPERCCEGAQDSVQYIDSVNNPDMRTAVAKLGGRDGIMMLLRQERHSQVRFTSEHRILVVSVTRVDISDERLNLAVIGLTQKAAVTGTLDKTRNRVVAALAASVLCIAVLEMAFVYVIVKPMGEIAHGLDLMMQLRDGSDVIKGSSPVNEVALMQRRFRMLNQQLMYMKAFLPHGVMGQCNAEVDDAAPQDLTKNETSRCSMYVAPVAAEKSTAPTTELSVTPTKVNDVDAFHFRFNENVLKDVVNQFRRRYCSVVCVSMALRDDDYVIDGLVQEFLGTCIPLLMRYGGVIEIQRPDFLMISFGAHSNMARNQMQAVCFAMELMQVARKDILVRLGAIVDAGEYLVGTCGAANRNARVTYGRQIPLQAELLRLVQTLKCHVLVTRPIAISLDVQFLTIPVDAVVCGVSNMLVVLYELRGHTGALEPERVSEVQRTARVIRHGFSNMLKGRYVEAARLLSRVGGKDVQADRLLRMCNRFIRKGITKPYLRGSSKSKVTVVGPKNSNHTDPLAVSAEDVMLPMLHLKQGFLREGTELENNVFGNMSLSAATLHRHTLPIENHTEANTDEECERGLFEMFLLSSSDEDEEVDGSPTSSQVAGGGMAPTFRGNAKGELPFVFTDVQGNSWTRSAEKIGVGAFSVVYRGMSSSGDLVALKCFALRARHIDIEDIVEELKLFSQLRHENIVQYISCYFSSDYLIEVMELVPGGSLDSILGNFGILSTMAVRRFLRDALRGLMYLHSKNVVHCDVKPHNVLVAMDGVCKLTDFGSSLLRLTNSIQNISSVFEMRGTPGYMAPEVARGEVPTAKSDVYSLGITALELLTGRLPWSYAATATSAASATKRSSLHTSNGDLAEQKEDENEMKNSAGVEQSETPTWFEHREAFLGSPFTGMSDADSAWAQTERCDIDWLLRSPKQLIISVGKGDVVPAIPSWLDDDVRDFVELCVAPEPDKRPTVEELLQDPWMF
ncbi:protein kinase [Trypanosoma grayi]|uniref:protein kinase n=1 Tax=Trypanosoma grayi TaxID=71804 RepID=UPI0004F49B65|nr:protein kinase [Trypanosoma grayi]KEG09636.1 protein kinase [Trypanosoma grayi]